MVLPSAITEAGKAAARTKSDSIGARPTITTITIATIIAAIVGGTVRQRDFVGERPLGWGMVATVKAKYC
jgi:hypothetical protein